MFYFQTAVAANNSLTNCTICGTKATSDSNPLPEHDRATHEVYAFLTWGMHSVLTVARPYVESWAKGTHRVPTNEEWRAHFGL